LYSRPVEEVFTLLFSKAVAEGFAFGFVLSSVFFHFLLSGGLHARFKGLQSLFDLLVGQFALIGKRVLNAGDQLSFIQLDAQFSCSFREFSM
jgi:hypothetical protein